MPNELPPQREVEGCLRISVQEGEIHLTLTEYMVRSKSEVVIANPPFDREIPVQGSPARIFQLPAFTVGGGVRIVTRSFPGGQRTRSTGSSGKRSARRTRHTSPARLVTTVDSSDLTKDAAALRKRQFTA